MVKVNCAMSTSSSDTVIGVLDIYGFEIFDNNSFEQVRRKMGASVALCVCTCVCVLAIVE